MGKNKGKRVKEKKKVKKHKIAPKIIIILIILLGIAGGVFAYKTYRNGGGLQGILATAMGHDENTKKNLEEFKVLIVGISTDINVELTDTIIVASYNPNTQKATLLSIPRDTFIGTNEKRASGYDKINAVFQNEGAEGTLEEVNDLTGLDIQYYVAVRTEALIKLVDAIGGVTFNVPIDMKYDDPTQDLHIDLKAGEQEIDGPKAEQLLRFRHNNNGTSYPSDYGDNDIGRMRTQREFMAETMRQTLKVENIFKLGQILDVAKENVTTNIDFNLIKDYIPYLVEFNTENLISDTLPGEPAMHNELWFYDCDEDATEELVKRLFYQRDYGEEATETENETTNTSNTSKKSSSKKKKTNTTAENKTKEELVIEVVNGTESTERYEAAIAALEAAGFKVTRPKTTKNTKTTVTSRTVITNQKYVKDELVDEVKAALGKGGLSNNASSSSESDLKIIIGTDY